MKRSERRCSARLAALAAALFLAAPGLARAVDGVIEINQARALEGGVTSGDAAGFPVLISEPGSYRLTSNLTVPNASTTAISIGAGAERVAIDLNGFALVGPAVCNGLPVVCNPSGTGDGIQASSGEAFIIHDGVVQGFGDDGISVVVNADIEDVIVRSNGGDGIFINTGTVSRCIVRANAANGIRASAANSVLAGNIARENGLDGINTSSDSIVKDNTVAGNGGDGIEAGVGSVVTGNSADANVGFGLRVAGAGYANNVVGNNTAGTVSGGTELGTNLCGGDTICP